MEEHGPETTLLSIASIVEGIVYHGTHYGGLPNETRQKYDSKISYFLSYI